jgi:hypothetical protein
VILPDDDMQSVDGKDPIRNKGLWKVAVWLNRIQAPFLRCWYIVTLAFVFAGPFLLVRTTGTENGIRSLTVSALAVSSVGTFVAFCFLEAYYRQYGLPHLGAMAVVGTYAVSKTAGLWSRGRRSAETNGAADHDKRVDNSSTGGEKRAAARWLVTGGLALFLFAAAGLMSPRIIRFFQVCTATSRMSVSRPYFSSRQQGPINFQEISSLNDDDFVRIRLRFRAEASPHPYPNIFQTAPGNEGVRIELVGGDAGIVFSDRSGKVVGVALCFGCPLGTWHSLDVLATRDYFRARLDNEVYDSLEMLPNVRLSDVRLGEGFSPERAFCGEISDFHATLGKTRRGLAYCLYQALRIALFGVFAYACVGYVRSRRVCERLRRGDREERSLMAATGR